MGILELFLIAISLSMDAFAVSICKGLTLQKFKLKYALTAGVYFGLFQATMPVIGYFVGKQFTNYITTYDHWIAFILLSFVGIKMLWEALKKDDDDTDTDMSLKAMLPLAIATSIDALAVGITFAFLKVGIFFSSSLIGITTFIISALGVKIGSLFGAKHKKVAEISGGIVLILLGLKMLLQGLGVIKF